MTAGADGSDPAALTFAVDRAGSEPGRPRDRRTGIVGFGPRTMSGCGDRVRGIEAGILAY
ncbi:hypothetical protein [Amycolatopsis thermophila]|uniref:Uncharacterized protein n=1 Tax=Amycolatopsis thermophila TaxID=206084 RepID=A0ABU0F4N6_9PSEU|nr:hypothetical protein [Amycolatopsis thermophila]MDQ0382496.1 hypothetical protein [Amycolatopsis thermophila]